MGDKLLSVVNARPGNYKTVRTAKGDEPQVDAVQLRAEILWLKSDQLAVADLTPRAARALAVQLLEAAQVIEDRLAVPDA